MNSLLLPNFCIFFPLRIFSPPSILSVKASNLPLSSHELSVMAFLRLHLNSRSTPTPQMSQIFNFLHSPEPAILIYLSGSLTASNDSLPKANRQLLCSYQFFPGLATMTPCTSVFLFLWLPARTLVHRPILPNPGN